jgi:biopolymer transport protein TolR
MYERRKRTRLMNQINVVPYIDVMLVLLVIFMVTAPLITTSVIDLPTVGRSQQSPVNPIEVMIKKDGSMLVRDRERGGIERRVDRDSLVHEIKKLQARADQPVVIAADQDVPYKFVVRVMDLLQSGGVARVGLLTRPGNG